MQKGFINNNNEFLVKNIENLLKNNSFEEIIATKFVNRPDSQYCKFLNYERLCDEKSQEFAIALPQKTKIIEKTSYALPRKIVGGEARYSFVALITMLACLQLPINYLTAAFNLI